MSICSAEQLSFPGSKGRKVDAAFEGGHVTTDGGVLLVRQADRRLGLTGQVAKVLSDPRRKASCEHSVLSMLRQRVYGLAAGYEDLNDQDRLRQDLAWQTAVERDRPGASSSTLCRLENRAQRQAAVDIHAGLAARAEQLAGEPVRDHRRVSTVDRDTATSKGASSTAITIPTASCRCT